ncbi:VanZ family protein [Bacillus sp. sid0103]|uniref:VanZ family protein n=1 Tax=Bacillus sp. sid0103 TaxID=2856337 RepID=UPI0035B174C9
MACAVFASLYGIRDEIYQSFYAYRSASWFDLVKDFTGFRVCYYFIRGALFTRLGRILGRVLPPIILLNNKFCLLRSLQRLSS